MHLVPDVGDGDAPEGFTERLLQARLARFWRSFSTRQGAEYDLTVAEERYEKFYSEFLTTLPSAFALQPNKEWDELFPVLPLQRQHFYMTIFDSICWNFRPVLLLEQSHVLSLPQYKQVLLSSQKKALAMAALNVLETVSALHALLGASHTRYACIVFHTFEAAVLLVCLCIHLDFPDSGGNGPPRAIIADPFGIGMANVTQERCMQAAQDALSRLRMLAEISNMAEAGARTLARLLGAAVPQPSERSSCAQSWSGDSNAAYWPSLEHPDPSFLDELLSATGSEDSLPNWELFNMDFDYPLAHAQS